MRLYSDFAGRRTLEIVGDLVAVAVIALGIAVALSLQAAIAGLGAVGVAIQDAGSSITAPAEGVAGTITGNPLPLDFLAAPFQGIAAGGETLSAAGRNLQSGVELVAAIVGWSVAVLVVLVVALAWILPRISATVQRARLARFATTDGSRDLLALRALTRRPGRQLAGIPDPVGGWRRGDPATVARLAALELRAAGVRMRADSA